MQPCLPRLYLQSEGCKGSLTRFWSTWVVRGQAGLLARARERLLFCRYICVEPHIPVLLLVLLKGQTRVTNSTKSTRREKAMPRRPCRSDPRKATEWKVSVGLKWECGPFVACSVATLVSSKPSKPGSVYKAGPFQCTGFLVVCSGVASRSPRA